MTEIRPEPHVTLRGQNTDIATASVRDPDGGDWSLVKVELDQSGRATPASTVG